MMSGCPRSSDEDGLRQQIRVGIIADYIKQTGFIYNKDFC